MSTATFIVCAIAIYALGIWIAIRVDRHWPKRTNDDGTLDRALDEDAEETCATIRADDDGFAQPTHRKE